MPLPVLGVAARLLASSGVREAVKKYGVKAVEVAKKQIAKREAAITKSAKSANDKTLGTYKRPRSKAATEMRTANKSPSSRSKVKLKKNSPIGGLGAMTRSTQGGRMKPASSKASELLKKLREKGTSTRSEKMFNEGEKFNQNFNKASGKVNKKMLKMKSGGKVRGAGIARKGVRKARML